jgi:hypothetical protein
MKIHGNYYKNTKTGKMKEEFELNIALNTLNLTDLRREATKILEEQDKEFRGIRELYLDLPKLEILEGITLLEIQDNPSDDEIRALAREKGLKNVGNKKIENLLKELQELEQKKSDTDFIKFMLERDAFLLDMAGKPHFGKIMLYGILLPIVIALICYMIYINFIF